MGAKKQMQKNVVTHSFKDLKKIIQRKKTVAPLRTVSVHRDRIISDEELFLDTMRDVLEIKEFREIPVYPKNITPSTKEKSSDREVLRSLEEIVAGQRAVKLSDTQEYVEWMHDDYRGDIVESLHMGNYSVQDSLDLHGMIVEEAEKEIDSFIARSIKKRHRCIKIIHGRGLCSPKGPVLKSEVIKWLSTRYRNCIIAFVTARQCDGGLGALYVLLR